MWIGILTVFSLLVGVAVFWRLPFSPVKADFERRVAEKIKSEAGASGVFTEADIEGLPTPVQRYFRCCGYLGTPKMTYMKASLDNVDFVMSESKQIKIDYKQFNLAQRPERLALISSSLSGIPFEGLDSYEQGKGGMKGRLGKVIPLFDQRGESMDRACLVTWLAECLMVPNAALQECIKWEPMDDTCAKAVVTWKGLSASGVFTFAATGELIAFRTKDRAAIDMKGRETQADWSAFFREYHPVNGILQPGVIQSVWHYQQGDCVYFNQNEAPVAIRYQ
ncbi:DUF6544 family protein [Desulfosporosinus youngiae]|uniref:Uncharacterized protein n=1 Tax=Desulfosporosinus youngiae DSM 17734 TaxID=768710 RepID=H5XWT4_9FIRM|nr:DUF6544 family protein [Desulfosporosinus youngiae]EHQ90733.1 hypothetical protein DesyoDRAFT_3742 [Desulfosporosinus youngiae DSM 17734]